MAGLDEATAIIRTRLIVTMRNTDNDLTDLALKPVITTR